MKTRTKGSEPPFAAPRTGFDVEGPLLLEFKSSFAPAAKGRFPPKPTNAASAAFCHFQSLKCISFMARLQIWYFSTNPQSQLGQFQVTFQENYLKSCALKGFTFWLSQTC